MKNYFLKHKKNITIPLVIVVTLFTFSAQRADAIIVHDPVHTAFNIFEQIAQRAVGVAADLAQEAARISIDSAAYAAGQALLNQVTDNTISWIRGGFNGSPSFDVNPEQLLLGLTDSVAGRTAYEIRGLTNTSFLPGFLNDLANSVELSTRSNASAKFADKLKSPFPQGVDASSFYNSGINSFEQNGGWESFQASLEDSGNSFGARVLISQELATRQNEALSIQEKKLARSSGFLDIIDESSCNYPESVQMIMTQNAGLDPASDAAYKRQYCSISTPGKIAGDQLTQALGIDMDRLGFVDNINKILGAIIRQLTTEAVKNLF